MILRFNGLNSWDKTNRNLLTFLKIKKYYAQINPKKPRLYGELIQKLGFIFFEMGGNIQHVKRVDPLPEAVVLLNEEFPRSKVNLILGNFRGGERVLIKLCMLFT